MTPEDLIRSLTPEVYENLKKSVELGRWPDGRVLTKEQKALSLEAVIQYEIINDIPAADRVGYMEDSCKNDKGSDEQVLTLQ